jgi:uncharacterized protein YqgV (UPF0045/DUF77 family)
MTRARLEFTVEPFVDGQPGPHVRAAIAAAETAGLPVEMGPFGSIVEGDEATVVEAVARLLTAGLANGATRISLEVRRL